MKKILLFFISFFALFSCGNNSDAVVAGIETEIFSGSGFSIQIPKEWASTGSVDSLSAWNGQMVLGAVSPEKKYNFSNNIIILKDDLKFLWTSAQYSEQNNLQTQKKYLEYSPVDSGAIIFGDSDEGKYFIFQAKYTASTQKLKFIQTAKTCGTKVFLLHASISLDSETKKFIDIFKTFQCS